MLAYIFDIRPLNYCQFTAVKTKESADQYHMTISRAQVMNSSMLHFLAG